MRRNHALNLAEIDLASLPLPPKGEHLIRDTVRSNLALRLRDCGTRTWIMFSTAGGKTVRRTIGDASAISAVSARAIANGAAAIGPDRAPSDSSDPAIFAPDASLADVLFRYLAYGANGRWRLSTGRIMERVGRHFILPYLGTRSVRDISRQDIAAWYAEIKLLGTSSRMALSTLSGAMRFAEDHGLRMPGSNPCRGLRKKERSGRGQLLPQASIRRLWQVLDRRQDEMPDACDAIRLLLLTGARKREILDLTWDQIAGCRAVLADSKTGPRTIWLNRFARSILAARQQSSTSDFVFAGTRRKGSISSIDRHWKILLFDAGIPPIRLHDLRHHFAASAVSDGIDLKLVGQLLGHSEIDSTIGYAHLASPALVKSATRVSRLIEHSLSVAPPPARSRKSVKTPEQVTSSQALREAGKEVRHG